MRRRMSPLLKVLVLLSLEYLFLSEGEALKCLFCDSITHPQYCDVVTTCNDGETCFAESVKTHDAIDAYRLGCKNGSTSASCRGNHNNAECAQCCDNGDLCNAQLCGGKGYPTQRGPICYKCNPRLLNEPCNVIDFCNNDELCGVSRRNIFSDILYTHACIKKHVCDLSHHEAIIGKRDTDLMPAGELQCCAGDLCNTATGTSIPLTTSLPSTSTTPPSNTTTTSTSGPKDCLDILQKGVGKDSGVYTIQIQNEAVQVYCDMVTDGGGWTVFHNRFGNTVDFNRSFSEYENGFGHINGEFWLGLRYIYELSTACPNVVLLIEVERADNRTANETFQHFRLEPPTNYTLHIDPGVGTAGDARRGLSFSNGGVFQTYDHKYSDCLDADAQSGGWWYTHCAYVNLNHKYYLSPGSLRADGGPAGMFYTAFNGYTSLKTASMKLRRKGC